MVSKSYNLDVVIFLDPGGAFSINLDDDPWCDEDIDWVVEHHFGQIFLHNIFAQSWREEPWTWKQTK